MEKIKVVLTISNSGDVDPINVYITRGQLNLLQYLQNSGAFDYQSEVSFEVVKEFPIEDLTQEY